MSPSVFFEIFFFLVSTLLPFRLVHSANTNSNNTPDNSQQQQHQQHHQLSEWTRSFDSQLQRIGSRLDNLMVRMDHLDSRVGRIQSLVQMRFDNIENGLTTTKLRMDLWGDDLNRIEEQLTRKWKALETKFDAVVGSVESKLDSKLNSIQRDYRRHNEFLSSSFTNVIVGQEKLNEKISNSISEVNVTLGTVRRSLVQQNSKNSSENNAVATLSLLREIMSNKTSVAPSENLQTQAWNNQTQNNYVLLTNKVTNMFDDLLKKSSTIEGSLKDSIAISNATRRDVHEGFRSVIATANQHNLRNGNSRSVSTGSSSELMSAVIVEALKSVETLSSALGRRLTELSRSIEERFEIVSTTLNAFLDSCMRIQDGEAMIEERIALVLDRMLDQVDNSTRTATQIWLNVTTQLLQQKLSSSLPSSSAAEGNFNEETPDETVIPEERDISSRQDGVDSEESGLGGSELVTTTRSNVESYARELLSASGDLTEEDKKSLWDSLFPVPE